MIPVDLPRVIPAVATRQVTLRYDGYCAHSPEGLSDSIPGSGTTTEDVVGIATVSLHGTVVGCVYRMASGRFYAQANQEMPLWDQRTANIVIAPRGRAPYGRRLLSGIQRIGNFPWTDLAIKNCRGSDYSKKI